jgi:hypothetical protein
MRCDLQRETGHPLTPAMVFGKGPVTKQAINDSTDPFHIRQAEPDTYHMVKQAEKGCGWQHLALCWVTM